ncbi:MAG: hypothetical protein ACTHLT_20095 [Devosia sp.]
MARRRRRSGSGVGGQVAAIVVVLVLIFAVSGGLIYLYLDASSRHVPIDPESLCPETGITAQTVVLLDTTDALAPVTRSQVLNQLSDVVAELPRGGLLELRVLNQDPGRTERLVHLCNPGDGADLNGLTANPELAKKRWREKFEAPVAAKLDAAVAGGEQNASPIMAALQQIAAEQLSKESQRSIPTRIVVVSDMLEHTQFYSMFRDGIDYQGFVAKAGARYLTDFAGARVDIWLVQRDRPDIDATALAEFWLRWIDAGHGTGTVSRLPGMA